MAIVPPGTVRDIGASAGDILENRLPVHRGFRVQIERDEPNGEERAKLKLDKSLNAPFTLLSAGDSPIRDLDIEGKQFKSGKAFKDFLTGNDSTSFKSIEVSNLIILKTTDSPITTSKTDALPFSFTAGCTPKPSKTTAHLTKETTEITLRHNDIQKALYNKLVSAYGEENIGTEQPSGNGTSIDVVVRYSDSCYWYYEIKTASSPRICIREAIGQLLEYSYWPRCQEAAKLIIVGETPLDTEGESYLDLLKTKFSIPIEYVQITL